MDLDAGDSEDDYDCCKHEIHRDPAELQGRRPVVLPKDDIARSISLFITCRCTLGRVMGLLSVYPQIRRPALSGAIPKRVTIGDKRSMFAVLVPIE